MVAFGVAHQATISKDNGFNITLFRDIMNNAYWSIYGQMDVLGCINGDSGGCVNAGFVDKSADFLNFDFILLTAYAIIVLVLVNVLIAQFK